MMADGVEVGLSAKQVGCIRKHLSMVFIHEIDPSYGKAEHLAALSQAHEGSIPNDLQRPPQARC